MLETEDLEAIRQIIREELEKSENRILKKLQRPRATSSPQSNALLLANVIQGGRPT